MHLVRKTTGIVVLGKRPGSESFSGAVCNRGDGTAKSPGHEMLNVPTLWTVFVINFLALGLIWAYVIRSYQSFHAARFWAASSLLAASGTAIAMSRVVTDSLIPLLAAGTTMIFALWL